MAKRYHQSKKDRRDESMGMYKASPMIKEDRSAPCNLPKHVIDEYWPNASGYSMKSERIGDLFNGIQKQMREDAEDFKRAMDPKKY